MNLIVQSDVGPDFAPRFAPHLPKLAARYMYITSSTKTWYMKLLRGVCCCPGPGRLELWRSGGRQGEAGGAT